MQPLEVPYRVWDGSSPEEWEAAGMILGSRHKSKSGAPLRNRDLFIPDGWKHHGWSVVDEHGRVRADIVPHEWPHTSDGTIALRRPPYVFHSHDYQRLEAGARVARSTGRGRTGVLPEHTGVITGFTETRVLVRWGDAETATEEFSLDLVWISEPEKEVV